MQWVGAGEVKETQRSRRGRRRVEDMMAVRGGRGGEGQWMGVIVEGVKGQGEGDTGGMGE